MPGKKDSEQSEPEDYRLKIEYGGPVQCELEKILLHLLKFCGWTWYGHGVDLTTGKRDLSFYKQGESGDPRG